MSIMFQVQLVLRSRHAQARQTPMTKRVCFQKNSSNKGNGLDTATTEILFEAIPPTCLLLRKRMKQCGQCAAILKVMCFKNGYLRLKHSWCKLSPYVSKWIYTYPLSIIAQLSCLFINRTMFSNTRDVHVLHRPGRAHKLSLLLEKYNSTATFRIGRCHVNSIM